MSPLPYRTARLGQPVVRAKVRLEDGAVVTALALFWVVSLLRVVGGLIRHEVFGAEGTLALLAIVAVPRLVWAR